MESERWRLFCDKCCEEYEDSEVGNVVFDAPGQAVATALAEGWTTDGRHWHCEHCSDVFPLSDPSAEPTCEPVVLIPGQERLDV